MINKRTAFAAFAALVASVPAHAAVTISTAATRNMTCAGGICTPTATKAVLNASDLQNYLSQFGNVHVATTGNGVEANNIVVSAAFATPDSTSLTLDAHGTITVNAAVSIGSNVSELELQSDTGGQLGTLSFGGRKGHVTFGSVQDIFGINGDIFTLVDSVQGLASAVAANPSGAYALANSYDASQDGTYSASPIPTTLTGTFEGLGNVISNLKIYTPKMADTDAGLFATVQYGQLRDIGVEHVRITLRGKTSAAGALVASICDGVVSGSHSSGFVHGHGQVFDMLGGLVGISCGHSAAITGYITNSSSIATVVGHGKTPFVGGLVGFSEETQIENSFATGRVVAGTDAWVGDLAGTADVIVNCFASGPVTVGDWDGDSGPPTSGGGLVGYYFGSYSFSEIRNSYSTGSVFGGQSSNVGGLIGVTLGGAVMSSYSTGSPSGGSYVGGFVGYASDNGYTTSFDSAYWDTDTSGITDPSQGAGNIANDPGITGLTTQQLQSGLPAGFDPAIWAEDAKINGGFPYLIANPPPK